MNAIKLKVQRQRSSLRVPGSTHHHSRPRREDGEVGVVRPLAQQGGQLPEARKGEEPDAPHNAPKKQFCWHLDFSAMRSTLDSDRQSCTIINLCYISCWAGGNLWEQLLLEQTTPFCFLTRTSAIGRARGRRSKGERGGFCLLETHQRNRRPSEARCYPCDGWAGLRQERLRAEDSHQSLQGLTPTSLCAPPFTISKINYI